MTTSFVATQQPMELQATSFRPLVESHADLEPYLAGLNVTEALQDFGRLADLVLSSDGDCTPIYPQQQEPTMMATSGYGSTYFCSPSTQPQEFAYGSPVVSPDGASLYSGETNPTSSPTASSHWSFASSPLASDHSSSFSYTSASSCSAFSSSAAGSECGDLDNERPTSTRRRRASSRKQERGPDRKRQNATAAERYRRKQKGRKSGLDEELERERARNAKLLQSFEAKLELYREFADLLAANTRHPSHDLGLAQLGSRSLENILKRICPAQFLAANQSQRLELERLHEHFRRLLSVTWSSAA